MSFSAQRKKAGMSQAEVARAMQVSNATVSYWDAGKTLPDPRKLPQLAKLFCCTVDEILAEAEAKQTCRG